MGERQAQPNKDYPSWNDPEKSSGCKIKHSSPHSTQLQEQVYDCNIFGFVKSTEDNDADRR